MVALGMAMRMITSVRKSTRMEMTSCYVLPILTGMTRMVYFYFQSIAFFFLLFTWVVLTAAVRYNGGKGYIYDGVPTLAIGLCDGRIQVSAGVADETPLSVRTGICLKHVKWSFNGSMLALGGNQVGQSGGLISMVLYE